jgi:hypothetical protein
MCSFLNALNAPVHYDYHLFISATLTPRVRQPSVPSGMRRKHSALQVRWVAESLTFPGNGDWGSGGMNSLEDSGLKRLQGEQYLVWPAPPRGEKSSVYICAGRGLYKATTAYCGAKTTARWYIYHKTGCSVFNGLFKYWPTGLDCAFLEQRLCQCE